MKSLWSAGWSLAAGAIVVNAGWVLAQDRGRDDRGRDRGREERRDFDPRDLIRQADDNNDGTIDPSEVGTRSGYYIRRAAERAGLDPSKPLPVAQILPALEAMRSEAAAGSSSSGSSSGTNRAAAPPTTNAFGTPPAAPAGAGGFGAPLTASSGASVDKKYDQRVIDYVNDMIRERDVNKNGILEKTEWTGRWSTPPEESDTNKDGVLDKDELCARIAKRFGISGSGSAPGSATSSGGPPAGPFGGPPGGSPPSPYGTPGGGPPSEAARYRGYAEGLLRQYDKNKDGKLDKDEFSSMKADHQAADVNKDNIITTDELAAKLQNYATGSSTASSGSVSSGSAGSSDGRGPSGPGSSDRDRGRERGGFGFGPPRGPAGSDKAAAAPPKRSYKLSTPTERLPKGMPEWFLRGDADGDGQVSMAEYTSTWTEQLAAEFMKLDTNADGIITPEECQAQERPRR